MTIWNESVGETLHHSGNTHKTLGSMFYKYNEFNLRTRVSEGVLVSQLRFTTFLNNCVPSYDDDNKLKQRWSCAKIKAGRNMGGWILWG